jgi:Ca2+-binding RTX toxin-like protein
MGKRGIGGDKNYASKRGDGVDWNPSVLLPLLKSGAASAWSDQTLRASSSMSFDVDLKGQSEVYLPFYIWNDGLPDRGGTQLPNSAFFDRHAVKWLILSFEADGSGIGFSQDTYVLKEAWDSAPADPIELNKERTELSNWPRFEALPKAYLDAYEHYATPITSSNHPHSIPKLVSGSNITEAVVLIEDAQTPIRRLGNSRDVIQGSNTLPDYIYAGGDNDDIYAGDGENLIRGEAGNDNLFGGVEDDALFGDEGNDILTGSSNASSSIASNAEYLNGGSGDDQIYGEAGSDFLDGMAGNDIIYGDHKNSSFDQADNSDDIIDGGSGNDKIYGGSGFDYINGGIGDDFLDGGGGSDTLIGETGTDTYVVDSPADQIFDTPQTGIETVRSSVTWTLQAGLDHLILTGTSAINGTGNNLKNKLTGNSANNYLFGGEEDDVLDGGAGDDQLEGGTGNDLYKVDSVGDVIVDTPQTGIETVEASVDWTLIPGLDNLTLTGSAAIKGTGNNLPNLITGNGANNVLSGDNGNDTLNGKAGNDRFNGGAGNDINPATKGSVK